MTLSSTMARTWAGTSDGIGEPEQRAVGLAHVGEGAVPEGLTQPVHVAGDVDRPDVGQEVGAVLLAGGRELLEPRNGRRLLARRGRHGSRRPGWPPGLPQVTGSLRCTPRGSKSTMSKSSSSCGVSALSSLAMSSIPDTPGPPGSMTRDPMRAAGSSAGWRATAIGMVGPSGSRVVQRDDEGAALQVAVAGRPRHGCDGRLGGGRRGARHRRGPVACAGAVRAADDHRGPAAGRHHRADQ